MADYPILTSPDGSTSFNVGSVMILQPEPDYGMAGMFANGLGGNPLVDGGNLGYRYSPPRMFKLPIRLATVGNLTPAGVARALRNMAQPGAWIDLMLQGVATADAVRFDVIDGRVRETQAVQMWAGAGRREGMLELDVQPYGYWPTWITLASVPSIALPGRITIPGASIIGDVPGLAQINVFSNLPSQQFGAIGTYGYDAFFYSMGNKQGAFIPAASMTSDVNQFVQPSLVGDAVAPGSQVQRLFFSPSQSIPLAALYGAQIGWQKVMQAPLVASYYGRYRAFAFGRLVVPSYGGAIAITADMGINSGLGFGPSGLASGGLIATIGQPLTLASDGAYSPGPTAFGFYPLGDLTIPTAPNAATVSSARMIRLWANIPSTGLPTVTFDIAGLWLQSLEGAQGVITRDLQNPQSGSAGFYGYNMFPFSIDAQQRDVQAAAGGAVVYTASTPSSMPLSWMGSQAPIFSLADRYRGVWPQVSPSMTTLEIMLAARRLQVTYRNEVLIDTPKLWWRFNDASGAATVQDWSGNGFHGAASNMLLGASSLLYGEPGGATGATQFAQSASGLALVTGNAPRTLEAWYQPAATYSGLSQEVAQLGDLATAFALTFNGCSIQVGNVAGQPSYPYAWQVGKTYHIAAAYDATNVTLYVNGQGQGTKTFAAALNTIGRLTVGNFTSGGGAPAFGGIDEVAVYPSALSAARILAHYLAGRNTQGATSPPVYHQGGFAGVSVRYQPRFAFQKEF